MSAAAAGVTRRLSALGLLALGLLLHGCAEHDAPTGTPAGASSAAAASPAAEPGAAAGGFSLMGAGTRADQPSVSALAGAAPSSPQARADGYGPLTLGSDESRLRKNWGGDLLGLPSAGSRCLTLRPSWVSGTPPALSFMLEDGRFVRYDVRLPQEQAPGGGKLGMGVDQLKQLYGAALTQAPQKYQPGALDLRIENPKTHSVLLFELGPDGKVRAWRVGLPPQVDYVEGCG